MARFTKLVDTDAAAIADIYDLDLVHYRPIHGGAANSSYLLKTGERAYVLTFFEKRSLQGGKQLGSLLVHLTEHGFHTNHMVPTGDSRYVAEYLGKPMILKTWIKGETLRDSQPRDFQSLGKAIAQLHQIPSPDFLPIDHPYGLKYMPSALGRGDDQEYEAWLADKIAYLHNNFPAGLPKSLLHGDLFDDNILYHQGKFQAIIDFGDACNYTRAYDLGSVLFGACMVEGKLDVERAAGVMRGYLSSITLEPEEKDSLQFFSVYAGAAISAWHYRHTFHEQPLHQGGKRYQAAAERTDHLLGLKASVFRSLFV